MSDNDDRVRSFDVRILKRDYSGVLATVPLYETVSVTWQDLGIGTASLVGGEDTPLIEGLACSTQPVPVTIKKRGLPRWTGRVAAASADREAGKVGQVQLTCVDDNKVHIDGNHPLAGQTLHFNVEVTDVREASAEELQHGHVHGAGGHHH